MTYETERNMTITTLANKFSKNFVLKQMAWLTDWLTDWSILAPHCIDDGDDNSQPVLMENLLYWLNALYTVGV